jgi:hypothetical protein
MFIEHVFYFFHVLLVTDYGGCSGRGHFMFKISDLILSL